MSDALPTQPATTRTQTTRPGDRPNAEHEPGADQKAHAWLQRWLTTHLDTARTGRPPGTTLLETATDAAPGHDPSRVRAAVLTELETQLRRLTTPGPEHRR